MSNRDPWPTLVWMGILCGVALGAVVVLLFRGSRRSQSLLREPEADLTSLFDLAPLPSPRPTNVLMPTRGRPVSRTMTVSSFEDTILLQAVGRKGWKAWVRVLGPPGAFCRFHVGGTGDEVRLPAGSFQQMWIPAGELLSAQGEVPNVQISVSGGEA